LRTDYRCWSCEWLLPAAVLYSYLSIALGHEPTNPDGSNRRFALLLFSS
jgi:hypothetical protein